MSDNIGKEELNSMLNSGIEVDKCTGAENIHEWANDKLSKDKMTSSESTLIEIANNIEVGFFRIQCEFKTSS